MTRVVFTANVATLSIGAIGAAIAWLLNFPAPALTGPALLVSVCGVLGIKLGVVDPIRNACFVIIGLSLGTGVTPDVMEAARQWPASFIGLTASLIVVFSSSTFLLARLWKFDANTSLLCSSPGHLSYVLGLSSAYKADLAVVSVVQSIRVLALTLVVPLIVSLMGYDTSVVGIPGEKLSAIALLISIVCALILGFGLTKMRVPAAFLIGGMIFSTLSHLSGYMAGHVPTWAAVPAFVIMGSFIGTRFSGISFQTLRHAFSAGVLVTVVAMASTCLFAVIVAQFINIPLPQLMIAFAPGGVEAMAAMGTIMGADPTFVAIHHVWRLFILTFLAPTVLAYRNREAAS